MDRFVKNERLLVSVPVYTGTPTNEYWLTELANLYAPTVSQTAILAFERSGYTVVNRFPVGPDHCFIIYDLRYDS
jgi:hypothetical protein